ncbi:MAG TPA: tryptophan synthase subunit alpha [Flavipsychrobacter sp.]|nr:tryptophan synthase subunit alpha [Flavipsychrobacter sp.]
MDRIELLFQKKENNILSIYFTAGHPTLDSTIDIIKILSCEGVDMIEIGMPFSDPVADGTTIQESSQIALKNGMSLSLLFDQLKDVRQHTQVPLILMGYFNPIMQFGINNFCKKAKDCGIDGILIPDLPTSVYEASYKYTFKYYGLKMIFMITPQTNEERIKMIDDLSDGFIYMVTSPITTGNKIAFTESHFQYLDRIKKLPLRNKVLAGFGISSKHEFEIVNEYVTGAIIGSSFIRSIAGGDADLQLSIQSFIKSFRS